MKKFVIITLIIGSVTNSILCSDTSSQMRQRLNREQMLFATSMLLHPDAWPLFKARIAVERLAYNAGINDMDLDAWMGTVPVGARGDSIKKAINDLRIKALEAGLVENINDLVELEELEEIDSTNSSTRMAMGIR
jgi:hypothetical protein